MDMIITVVIVITHHSSYLLTRATTTHVFMMFFFHLSSFHVTKYVCVVTVHYNRTVEARSQNFDRDTTILKVKVKLSRTRHAGTKGERKYSS
jgi:hypothetical protein